MPILLDISLGSSDSGKDLGVVVDSYLNGAVGATAWAKEPTGSLTISTGDC